jgi:NADPH-dependent curcumin reductase CurA
VTGALTNAQFLLDRHPDGTLLESHFRKVVSPIPIPRGGQVLCRTLFLSLDPANRAWMQGRTYRDQIRAGEVMSGFTLSEVVDGRQGGISSGMIVACEAGWQEYAALPASDLRKIEVRGALSHHLSVLGITGMTAYFGLFEIGRVCPGETVVVSAAAGATGNVVGQLARIAGARVVGVSGSDDKNRILEDELGFHGTVNYRSERFLEQLKDCCPDGVDVYFDNVAGEVLAAVLLRMNTYGRVVCCGAVSQYESTGRPAGPPAVPGLIVTRRLRMEGFIVTDFRQRWEEAIARLSGLVDDGRLRVIEDIWDGLDAAPAALVDLLRGGNVGKRMVRVADSTEGTAS